MRGCYCRLWGAHSPRSPGTPPGGLTPPRAGNPALVSMVVMPCAGTRGGCPTGHLDGGWGTIGLHQQLLEQESRDRAGGGTGQAGAGTGEAGNDGMGAARGGTG